MAQNDMVLANEQLVEEVKELRSVNDAVRFYERLGVQLNTNLTPYDSLITDMPDTFHSWISKAGKAKDFKEASGVCADMLGTVVRKAYPSALAATLLSKGFQDKIHGHFQRNEFVNNVNYDQYMAVNETFKNKKVIDDYLKDVERFRTRLGFEEVGSETIHGVVSPRLASRGASMPLLLEMTELIKTRSGASSAGAEHAEEFLNSLDGDWTIFPVVAFYDKERKAKGFAVTIAENEAQNEYNVLSVEGGGNALLMSSALASRLQRRTGWQELLQGYKEKAEAVVNPEVRRYYLRVVYEAENMVAGRSGVEGETDGESFVAQQSNIDPIYLFGFIVYGMAKCSVSDFYYLQPAIYACTQKYRGKTNLQAIFSSSGLRGLGKMGAIIRLISGNTDIHLPPFVLNYSRLFDLCAPVCPFSLANIKGTARLPSVIFRSGLGFKPEVKGMLAFITTLYSMEKIAQQKEGAANEEIYLSVRMLQQYIVGRVGPLTNTNFLVGRAGDVVWE